MGETEPALVQSEQKVLDIFQNGDVISIPLSKSSYDGSDAEIKDEKITYRSPSPSSSKREEQSEDELPPGEREDGSGEEKSVSFIPAVFRFLNHDIFYRSDQRKEPLGGPGRSDEIENEDGPWALELFLQMKVQKRIMVL
ncbi:partitioning defective 3 [Caerostris extrusa]|uniref:Partitioning defective 3 n=1 Tax=Caerostris extrusa TaxID=172846 RepID=A0AAV4QXH4_CAEEX|nr:partitioning defective 3 [Caerostris extrusa]